MEKGTDGSPIFSGRALARAAGVLPQTRESWVRRGLLSQKASYDFDDLLEVVVLDLLLRHLPKGDAAGAWNRLRSEIASIETADTAVVWESGRGVMRIVNGADEMAEAVLHGRPVQVLPIGEVLTRARADFLGPSKL